MKYVACLILGKSRLKNLLFLLALPIWGYAQDTDMLLNHDLYAYMDRIDVRGYADTSLSLQVKPLGRSYLAHLLNRVNEAELLPVERAWHLRMRYLVDDDLATRESGAGIWRFYTNRRDLIHIDQPGLRLYINPVLHTSLGLDRNSFPTASTPNLPIYVNSRGVVVRGSLFNTLGFHTEVADNVSRFPQFVFDRYQERQVLYGEGFVKRFGDQNGLDYFSSRAYLTYSPFSFLRIKFGKDRMAWGHGQQSLFLSDYAADYLLLTLQTRIWKLVYTNHFTQLIDFIPNKNDTEGTFPRKYGVFHQLSYHPNPRLSFSLFESIIYQPWLANGRRGFELSYLNPLIFYRAIEQVIGSPDNSMLGLQAKWNLLKRVQAYGQILLDDFNFARAREGKGYWGNKFGYQLGLKYMDAFDIPTLDLQAEYNRIRPYTYQHFSQSSNYTHYGQSLGHAAGANLQDIRILARYHPFPAWNLVLSYAYLQQGLDENGINYGSDLRLPYVNRPADDFNQTVGQGQPWRVHQVYGRLSFQPWLADVVVEVEGRLRQEGTDNGANKPYSASILGGVRIHLVPRPVRF